MLLTRESLLKKEPAKVSKVSLGLNDQGVEEEIYVKVMNGHDRDVLENSLLKPIKDKKGNAIAFEQDLTDYRAKIAVQTICDEKGNRLLKWEDYPLLAQNYSSDKLDLIATEARKLNKMNKEDLEEVVKNSEPVQEDSSTSNLQEN